MEKVTTPQASIEFIRSKYLEKKKLNPQYSLSAFARDLGLSISFLSRLMSGERPVTMKQGVQIAALLGLTSDQTDRLLSTIVAESGKNAKISKKIRETFEKRTNAKQDFANSVTYYEVERFKAMGAWYHLAILNLTYVKDFKPSSSWISNRLGITKIEAIDAISRLLHLGLLEKTNGTLRKTKNHLIVDTNKSELAVREFHTQMIEKAGNALREISQEAFERRYISGTTIAINADKIPELRKKLMNFQNEIMQMASAVNSTDVYQVNLQLFPLTHSKKD